MNEEKKGGGEGEINALKEERCSRTICREEELGKEEEIRERKKKQRKGENWCVCGGVRVRIQSWVRERE